MRSTETWLYDFAIDSERNSLTQLAIITKHKQYQTDRQWRVALDGGAHESHRQHHCAGAPQCGVGWDNSGNEHRQTTTRVAVGQSNWVPSPSLFIEDCRLLVAVRPL
jgi:hypothetical protein